jgi:hypothetical protein
MVVPFQVLQNLFVKCNDKETMAKNLNVQNKICSYVPKLNIDPFTRKRHILLIP